MYVILDRRGVVRYVQAGHSPDLAERLTAVTDRLVHEETDRSMHVISSK